MYTTVSPVLIFCSTIIWWFTRNTFPREVGLYSIKGIYWIIIAVISLVRTFISTIIWQFTPNSFPRGVGI